MGALGLSAALVMLLLAITKGGDWGWASGAMLDLLAGSFVVFLVWGAWELRRTPPFVDLRVSAGPQVLFTNIASVAVGFAMYGMSLIRLQILLAPEATGYGPGLSMTEAGLLMAPSGLVMYLFSSVGTSLSSAVISVVLAHEIIRLGPVALPSYHGFTIALWISIAAAVFALAFTALIPARAREDVWSPRC